jgi:site-specific recombinase XerD
MYEDEGTLHKRRFNYEGTPISVRDVMKIMQKYAGIAGITKHFSCHSLRHTCGTYKAKMGLTGLQTKALLGMNAPRPRKSMSILLRC